jgi:Ca-activated chloride channel family protein
MNPSTSAPSAERILHRLEWQIIRRLDGYLQGNHRSLFRGFGLDFSDLREYQPQDDVRHIDWRRHVPFLLFLGALASLTIALGRPAAVLRVPDPNATVILAIDVSRSMCSTDILPSRLEAAKQSAMQFVENQDGRLQIGLVAFAGFAVLIQPPTSDRDLLLESIRNLATARRTAIGEGILMSIDAIADVDDSVISPYAGVETVPVPSGYIAPEIIVLLTDGVSTTGIHPLAAAQEALDRGIRVYTIGFGTDHNASIPNCGNPFAPGGQFQFGGGGGGGFRREIDEATLIQVAEMTGGSYHLAESADDLQRVFDELPTRLITTTETMEVSALFVFFGLLLAVLAIALSMAWQPMIA